MKLSNKIAVVTAATKGIGLASALILAKNGATVYLGARNKELADEIIKKHKDLKLKFVNFDAKDENSIKKMINDVYDAEGSIDILVNNYGQGNAEKDLSIFDTNIDIYMEILNYNIKSVFIACQEACIKMKKTGGGSIVNISSIGSISPDIARIGYCTSKATINSLTQNIAAHGAKYQIRCNAILPGYIETLASKTHMPESFLNEFIKNTPLSRVGKPEDIANCVLFLASDDSSYLTGELIPVAGGFSNVTPLYSVFNKK